SVRVAAQLVETLHAPEELTEAQRDRLWEPPRETTDCLDAAFTMAPGETRPIAFTYAIAGGGAKRISLRVAWERMATTIFAGSAATNVYDLRTATRDQRLALETLSNQFAAIGRLEDYRTLVEAFGGRLEAARRQLTLIDAPGGDPNANIVRSQDLAGQIRDLRRRYANELAPAVWAVKTGVKDLDFCVGVVHPTDKVFRDDVFAGSLGDQVEIGLAANEYESAQFVILRLGDRPGRLVCSATDLVHADDAGAVIPAGRIEFAEVGYIQVGDTGKGTRSGAWPDILYPTNSVAYGQHDLQPVMLTVFAAPGQKPGRYMGRVTFANERGQALSMRLGVTVFDFELPRFRSLRSSFWFWVHRPRTYYGHRLEGAFFSVELYREFADILGRYQMAPSPRGDLMPRLIRLRRDTGGNVTFDFSGIDPYWKASIEAGANVLYIDRLGTNFFLKPEKSWQPHAVIVDEATGAEEDFVADDPERMADDYLRAVVRHFKARGWFDKAVTQVSDEPWS
ncbi:MAG: hypothetical protein GX595_15620, partial [Lentisphaerae bacterium]|nr:hypothetical protein [Lentisphaerota bacterium]